MNILSSYKIEDKEEMEKIRNKKYEVCFGDNEML